MDLRVLVEAGVFLLLAAVVAAAVTMLAQAMGRHLVRSRPTVVGIATAASFVVTELWAQLSHVMRYSRITLLVCVVVAAVVAAAQTRGREAANGLRD